MTWYSTPASLRKRKPLQLTLSPEALDLLTNLATAARISRSLLIEGLILAAEKAASRKRKAAP